MWLSKKKKKKKIPNCAGQFVLFNYSLFKPAALQESETKKTAGEGEKVR